MTQDELIELLNAHEWRDVEFKSCREMPKEQRFFFNVPCRERSCSLRCL